MAICCFAIPSPASSPLHPSVLASPKYAAASTMRRHQSLATPSLTDAFTSHTAAALSSRDTTASIVSTITSICRIQLTWCKRWEYNIPERSSWFHSSQRQGYSQLAPREGGISSQAFHLFYHSSFFGFPLNPDHRMTKSSSPSPQAFSGSESRLG